MRKNQMKMRSVVAHYIEAGMTRRRRKQKRNGKSSKKSSFVQFFESLQNRGGLGMSTSVYERWAITVRKEMEKEGTWPTDLQEWDLSVVAEYVSRLQRRFWKEHRGLKWYRTSVYNHLEEMRPHLRVLKKIYNKIRKKGLRDRIFRMPQWHFEETPVDVWIYGNTSRGKQSRNIHIRPYTPFCDHGAGI